MLMNPEVWVLVAFLLFFTLFGRQIWRPLMAMLDRRSAAIAAELEQAAQLRRDAEEMLRAAQHDRAEALREAQTIVARGHAEAARVAQEAEQDAAAQARRRERMALDRIAAAEKAAVEEVRQAAAEIAVSAARSVISETLTGEDDAAIVDRAIADLPKVLRAA